MLYVCHLAVAVTTYPFSSRSAFTSTSCHDRYRPTRDRATTAAPAAKPRTSDARMRCRTSCNICTSHTAAMGKRASYGVTMIRLLITARVLAATFKLLTSFTERTHSHCDAHSCRIEVQRPSTIKAWFGVAQNPLQHNTRRRRCDVCCST